MDKAVSQAEQVVLKTEDKLESGEIDTTETPARFLGLLARIRPVLQPASRYLACGFITSWHSNMLAVVLMPGCSLRC